MRLRASPKDVLRLVVVLVLGGMALGALITLVVVGAGKLGVELMPTVEMRLFIATTAWFSLLAWLATIAGFGFAAVQLVRKAPGALWGWLIGFASSVVTQAAETAVAARAGAEIDTSASVSRHASGSAATRSSGRVSSTACGCSRTTPRPTRS